MKTWSAVEIHAELAAMAWERLDHPGPLLPIELLRLHVGVMADILSNAELYAALWRRLREAA